MSNENSNVRMRACALVVKYGKLLLVRHRNADYFMLPGGAIEPKEGVRPSLKREISEELLCKADKLEYFGTYLSPKPSQVANVPNCSITFFAEIIGEPKPAAEIIEVHFFTAAELEKAKLSQSAKFFAEKLVEKGIVK